MEMVRNTALTLFAAALALALAACSGTSEGRQEGTSRPPVAVETTPAVSGTLADTVEVVGNLEPKFTADIKSEFTSVVEKVYVTEWVHVAKGTPLARLDAREARAAVDMARAGLLQARVAEERAQRELERATKLKDYGLITQQGLDDAATARQAAGAASAAAQAQLELAETKLDKTLIRAPMDGVVAYRGVSAGDRVENMGTGEPMFRIVDNRLLDFTATVPSVKSAALRVGQPLEFTTDAFPARIFHGAVKFINPAIDPQNRSVKVIAEVHNTDGSLRGGLFARGRILTGTRARVLQIPRAALLSWDVARHSGEVFVVRDETAERRTVHTGDASGDLVEVTAGLAAGELVVTRGAFNLRPGDRVRVATPEGT
jgi:membrane fusion protein (multidrug efflux system)